MNKQWEYLMCYLTSECDLYTVEEGKARSAGTLTSVGAEGWELVTVGTWEHSRERFIIDGRMFYAHARAIAVFKRERLP